MSNNNRASRLVTLVVLLVLAIVVDCRYSVRRGSASTGESMSSGAQPTYKLYINWLPQIADSAGANTDNFWADGEKVDAALARTKWHHDWKEEMSTAEISGAKLNQVTKWLQKHITRDMGKTGFVKAVFTEPAGVSSDAAALDENKGLPKSTITKGKVTYMCIINKDADKSVLENFKNDRLELLKAHEEDAWHLDDLSGVGQVHFKVPLRDIAILRNFIKSNLGEGKAIKYYELDENRIRIAL